MYFEVSDVDELQRDILEDTIISPLRGFCIFIVIKFFKSCKHVFEGIQFT